MTQIRLKRAYEPSAPTDGFRVYVDRLWPRGLSHESFHYDIWEKQISPSTELREWYHADPMGRWEEFSTKYMAELKDNPAIASMVSQLKGYGVVTLIYSSRDSVHNNAQILAAFLTQSYPGIFSM